MAVRNFDNVPGHGFFGVYDGHAGKQAAAWCGDNLHGVCIGVCCGVVWYGVVKREGLVALLMVHVSRLRLYLLPLFSPPLLTPPSAGLHATATGAPRDARTAAPGPTLCLHRSRVE